MKAFDLYLIVAVGAIVLFQNCTGASLSVQKVANRSADNGDDRGPAVPNCSDSYVFADSPVSAQNWSSHGFKAGNKDYLVISYLKQTSEGDRLRTAIVETSNQGNSWSLYHDFDDDLPGVSIHAEPQYIEDLNKVVVLADVDPNPNDNVGESDRMLLVGDLLNNTWSLHGIPRNNVIYPIAIHQNELYMPVDVTVSEDGMYFHTIQVFKSSDTGASWNPLDFGPQAQTPFQIWTLGDARIIAGKLRILATLWTTEETLKTSVVSYDLQGKYLSETVTDPTRYDRIMVGYPRRLHNSNDVLSYRRIKSSSDSKRWVHTKGRVGEPDWNPLQEIAYERVSLMGYYHDSDKFYEAYKLTDLRGNESYKIQIGDSNHGIYGEIVDFTNLDNRLGPYISFVKRGGQLLAYGSQPNKIVTIRIDCND